MANYISKIDQKFVQDVSSLHSITVNKKTYTLNFGFPGSAYATTSVLNMPSDVMFFEDADAIIYKGEIAGSETSPGTAIPASTKGWLYKVTTAGYIAGVKCDYGDTIICNTTTTSATTTNPTNFDFYQGNIDSSLFSLKGHKHAVKKTEKTSSDGSWTPSGSVTTTVTGALSTFTGQNTPAGTITATFTTKSTTHEHTFTGTAGNISFTYKKPSATGNTTPSVLSSTTSYISSHTYKPTGTITPYISSEDTAAAMTVGGSVTQGTHNHTFTGTTKTISLSYKAAPADTSTVTVTVSGTIDSHSYTPTGTLSTPSITYTQPATGSITPVISFKSLSTWNMETDTDVLQASTYDAATEEYSFSHGTLTFVNASILSLNTSAYTGLVTASSVAAESSDITFYGDIATLSHTYDLTLDAHTHSMGNVNKTMSSTSYQPAGTFDSSKGTIDMSKIAITYTKMTGSTMSFAGDSSTISHSHNLTLAAHTHSIVDGNATASTSFTPSGTFSKTEQVTVNGATSNNTITMTFSGTKAYYTMSGTPLFDAISTFSGDTVAAHSHSFTLNASIGSANV